MAFTLMIQCGDLLIDAQRLDSALWDLYYQDPTPERYEAWQEARRWLQASTEAYAAAIQEWRNGFEIKQVIEGY